MATPIHKELRSWLEREVELGLEELPPAVAQRASRSVDRPRTSSETATAKPSIAAGAEARRVPAARAAENRPSGSSTLSDVLVEPAIVAASTLDQLRDVLGDCQRCKLCKGRKNIVYGVGNPNARLMFVGEGPGEDEDLRGEPFVGKAGVLLDRIITSGMGIRRDDVYIANVVKCRPPNNRNPEPDEIVACEPFLRRQVEIVRPEVIVSLGNFATQALLGDRTPISRRRGNWHEVLATALMPTFHPAYLLRNPSDKKLVWHDIQLVMERLGLPLPQQQGRQR